MEKLNIAAIKPNEENPRFITDAKFKKLVKSIKDFPEMLEARPLVIDEDNVVLGGNMRLKALKSAGIFEIPVKRVEGWTAEQKKEFIIKDNIGYGEWDWDILANNWDTDTLEDWGLTAVFFGHDVNEMTEDDLDFTEEFDPIGVTSGLRRVHFVFDGDEEAQSYLDSKEIKFEKKGSAWIVNMSTRYT